MEDVKDNNGWRLLDMFRDTSVCVLEINTYLKYKYAQYVTGKNMHEEVVDY